MTLALARALIALTRVRRIGPPSLSRYLKNGILPLVTRLTKKTLRESVIGRSELETPIRAEA